MFDTEPAAVNHVARQQAGGLRFHDLRHSYATWLVDDGVPVNMVQRVLGHAMVLDGTLDLYTRRTDDPSRVLRALDDDLARPGRRRGGCSDDSMKHRGAFLVPFPPIRRPPRI